MGDLTIETVAVCATNVDWSTKVGGSKGNIYTVRFCFQPRGQVQYDYECTCPAFTQGHRRCRHIEDVVRSDKRCAWNSEMDPGIRPNGDKCPLCEGPLHYLRVGV